MLKHMECIVTVAMQGQESLNILFDETCPSIFPSSTTSFLELIFFFSEYVGYQNFDLILMDCQMPVMDGFAATKRIRSWEADRNRTPPLLVLRHLTKISGKPPMKIISLSASGSSETEKQCYEAGMEQNSFFSQMTPN
jgi:CheY-like chemotaxis protein